MLRLWVSRSSDFGFRELRGVVFLLASATGQGALSCVSGFLGGSRGGCSRINTESALRAGNLHTAYRMV